MTRASAANATVPRPRLTARGVAVAAVCWGLFALLYAAVLARAEQIFFGYALTGQLLAVALLALASVPAWLLVVRRMDRAAWGWKGAAHLLIAPLYAWLTLESYLFLMRLLAGGDVAASIGASYGWIFFGHLAIYGLQFALYHAVRAVQRLRQKEKQAAELAALARKRELAALKAQVNPHFLFNALHSVSAAVKRDPDAARAMLEQLAGLLRYATGRNANGESDGGDGELATLEDELAFARRYLALESRRFGPGRLTAHFDVAGDALPARLPPMTLQPLVENAVRHGIAPLEAGGAVTVRVEPLPEDTGRVRVTVEDTGAGLNGQAPPESNALLDVLARDGGTGLQNTSARLQRHFGPEARLRAEAPRSGDGHAPSGFRVWFSVPATP